MPSATATEASPLTVTPPPAGEVTLQPLCAADRFLTDRRTLALFLISVVGLFLELLLIRWISTEIRIFAYLQNTVLVVCFLGLGMGCWDSRKPFALRDVLIPLTILVALLAIPTTRVFLGQKITDMLGQIGGISFWGAGASTGWIVLALGGVGLVLTLAIMYLLWATFVPVGRLLG